MPKKKTNTKSKNNNEPDSLFFLKILLFFILGSVWLQVSSAGQVLPIGIAIGAIFAHHDHFMIDRKIEFAVLLAAAFLSYVSPVGVVLLV